MFYKLINLLTSAARIKKNFILTIHNKIFMLFFFKIFIIYKVSSQSGSNEIYFDPTKKKEQISFANIFRQGINSKQYTNLKIWKEAFISDTSILSAVVKDKNFGSINEKIIIKPLINFNESNNNSKNDNIKTDLLFAKNYMHPSYACENAFHRFSQSNKYTIKKIFYSDINSIETLKDAFTFVNKWFNYIDGFINQTNIDIEKDYQVFLNKKFFSIETFKFLFNAENKQKINIFEEIFDINFNKNIKVFYNEIFFEIYKNSNFFNNFSKYNVVEYNNIYNNSMQDIFSIHFIVLIFFISSTIICFYNLIISNNAVSAITFFFIMIICFAAIFFYISTEYIASIVLMVYVGAIIIFFIFILFSSDIKRFSYLSFNNNKFSKPINFSFTFIFFIYFVIFYSFTKELIIPFFTNENFYKTSFNSDQSFIIAIGNLIYNSYYYHVTILGFLLLSSLFGAIEILNPVLKKKKFNKKKINKFINKLMFWHESFIDIFFILALLVLSMSYSCIASFNHSFIHIILIFESMILSICVIIAFSALVLDLIDGEIFILFIISVVAAETAVAISLFIKISIANPNKQYNYIKKKSYKNIIRFFIKKKSFLGKEKKYLFSDLFSFILKLREKAENSESVDRTPSTLQLQQSKALEEAKSIVEASSASDTEFIQSSTSYADDLELSAREVSASLIHPKEVVLVSSTEVTIVEETSTTWFTLGQFSFSIEKWTLFINYREILATLGLPLQSEAGWASWTCFAEEAIRCWWREFIFSVIRALFEARPRHGLLKITDFIYRDSSWTIYLWFKDFHMVLGAFIAGIFNYDLTLFWDSLAEYMELRKILHKRGWEIPIMRVYNTRQGMHDFIVSPLHLPEYRREGSTPWVSYRKTDCPEFDEHIERWTSMSFPERQIFQDLGSETARAIEELAERKIPFIPLDKHEEYKHARSEFITFFCKSEPEALAASLSRMCGEPLDSPDYKLEKKIRSILNQIQEHSTQERSLDTIPEDPVLVAQIKQLAHQHEVLKIALYMGDQLFCHQNEPDKAIAFFKHLTNFLKKHWFTNRSASAELTSIEPTFESAIRKIPYYNKSLTEEMIRTKFSRELLDWKFVQNFFSSNWDAIEKVYLYWRDKDPDDQSVIEDLRTFSQISHTIDRGFLNHSFLWKKIKLFYVKHEQVFEPVYRFIFKIYYFISTILVEIYTILVEIIQCSFSFLHSTHDKITNHVLPLIIQSAENYLCESFTKFGWFFNVEHISNFLEKERILVFFTNILPLIFIFFILLRIITVFKNFFEDVYFDIKDKYNEKKKQLKNLFFKLVKVNS